MILAALGIAALALAAVLLAGATGLLLFGIGALIRSWQAARAVIQLTEAEAEHAALLAALCDHCHGGRGPCTCTGPCGQLACLSGLSEEDERFTWPPMPEGRGQ